MNQEEAGLSSLVHSSNASDHHHFESHLQFDLPCVSGPARASGRVPPAKTSLATSVNSPYLNTAVSQCSAASPCMCLCLLHPVLGQPLHPEAVTTI